MFFYRFHIDCICYLETTNVIIVYSVSLKPVDSGLRYMPRACKTLVLTSKVKDLT